MRNLNLNLTTLVSAALLAVAAASCSVRVNETEKRDIVFDVAVAANTRNTSAAALFHPEDVDIAVCGYSLPASMSWSSDSQYAALEMDGIRATHTEGHIWAPSESHKWPDGDRTMTIFAYSPYGRGEFGDDGSIRVNDYSASEGGDLMFCAAEDRSYNTLGKINLSFTRALCLVDFNVLSSLDRSRTPTVSRLEISGLYAEGDFSTQPAPAWTTGDETSNFIFFEGKMPVTDQTVDFGECLYMIPQDGIMKVTLTLDLQTGDAVQEDLVLAAEEQISWQTGKHYSYILKIGNDLRLTVQKASANV